MRADRDRDYFRSDQRKRSTATRRKRLSDVKRCVVVVDNTVRVRVALSTRAREQLTFLTPLDG